MMNNFNIIYFRIFGELTKILNIMKGLYKYITYIWRKTKKVILWLKKIDIKHLLTVKALHK